jgi:hypothetical protein
MLRLASDPKNLAQRGSCAVLLSCSRPLQVSSSTWKPLTIALANTTASTSSNKGSRRAEIVVEAAVRGRSIAALVLLGGCLL